MMDSTEYKLLVSEGRQGQCEPRKGELLGKLLPRPIFFLLFFFLLHHLTHWGSVNIQAAATLNPQGCQPAAASWLFLFTSALSFNGTRQSFPRQMSHRVPDAQSTHLVLLCTSHTWSPHSDPLPPSKPKLPVSSIQMRSKQRTARVALEATIVFIPSAQSRKQ